jgi:drug/metabolite transporter (DMT)-like permease
MSNRLKGIACIVCSAFGFALMALFVGMCDRFGQGVSSFQKSFFRNLPAVFIALAVFLKSDRGRLKLDAKGWTILVLRSAIGAAGIFCNFYALSHIAIGEGMTLNKTAPFFTVFLSWLFLGERLGFRQFAYLALAFLGAMLIVKPGFGSAGELFPMSMALLGGVCAGSAYVCVHALGRMNVPGAFIVMFFSGFSCLAAVPFMVADITPMTPAQLFIMAGAGLGGAIGQFGVTWAYRFAEPRSIAVYDYSNVVFTALLGLVFLGQRIDFVSIAGMAVIVFCAFRVLRKG